MRIDLRTETVSGYLHVGGSPQVKLSPDGRTFYLANRDRAGGAITVIGFATRRVVALLHRPHRRHALGGHGRRRAGLSSNLHPVLSGF